MSRSNRGAARVSAIWIIVVGVIGLASVAFAFISQSDMTKSDDAAKAAEAAKDKAVADFQTVNTRRQDVVTLLGHFDATSADPVANLDEAKEAISGLRATFPDISETATSYQSVLPAIKAAYNAQADTIANQKTEIERLKAEVAAKATALADVTSEKEGKIQELTSQLADQQQNADTRQQDLQSTIDATRQTVADNDQESRNKEQEFATKEAAFMAAADLNVAKIGSLNYDLSLRTHEDNLRSDGEIQSVASGLGMAWIDRGSDDRLSVGTRFSIYGIQNGQEVLKAVGQVTKIVSPGMAEMSLTTFDNTDPVVAGDRIVNPFYDPNNVRKALMIGEFAGKAELVGMLGRMNIVVEDAMSIDTRLVIVGGPERVDPETGDAYDEPRSPEDLDAYKNAVAQNLQLMSVATLREYFPQTL